MGNHEYCVDCGESDFHYGRPCDPDKLAAEKERNRLNEERSQRLDEKAKRIVDALVAKGLPAEINHYRNVEIVKWHLDNVDITL